MEQKSRAELIHAQKNDATLGLVISALEDGKWSVEVEGKSELGLMKREIGRLVKKGGLL